MKPLEKSLFDYQVKISGAFGDLNEMLGEIYEGLMKHNKTRLAEAEKLGKKIHLFDKEFTADIVKEGNKDSVRLLIAMSGHVERIGDCMESIIKTVHAKINDHTLFSDKAVSELNYLFTNVKDLIRDMKDVSMTMNPVLMEHILNTGVKVNQMADEFATQHEERLMSGICTPAHSSMFLDMVDNLRMSVWHIKEIVRKIQSF